MWGFAAEIMVESSVDVFHECDGFLEESREELGGEVSLRRFCMDHCIDANWQCQSSDCI